MMTSQRQGSSALAVRPYARIMKPDLAPRARYRLGSACDLAARRRRHGLICRAIRLQPSRSIKLKDCAGCHRRYDDDQWNVCRSGDRA